LKKAAPKAMDGAKKSHTPARESLRLAWRLKGKSTSRSKTPDVIQIEMMRMEKRIGMSERSAAPRFIFGLFERCWGSSRLFRIIAQKVGGMGVVINGISEALICTDIGRAWRVPAVIAYNFFIKRIDDLVKDMEVCASEVSDL